MPAQEVIVGRSARLSYRDLDAAADRVAAALSGLGVRPGDTIAASMRNDAR